MYVLNRLYNMFISHVYTAVYRLITAYANYVDMQCKTHARIMNVNVKCLIFIIQYRGEQKEIRLPFLAQYQEVVTSESAHSASRTLRDACISLSEPLVCEFLKA